MYISYVTKTFGVVFFLISVQKATEQLRTTAVQMSKQACFPVIQINEIRMDLKEKISPSTSAYFTMKKKSYIHDHKIGVKVKLLPNKINKEKDNS